MRRLSLMWVWCAANWARLPLERLQTRRSLLSILIANEPYWQSRPKPLALQHERNGSIRYRFKVSLYKWTFSRHMIPMSHSEDPLDPFPQIRSLSHEFQAPSIDIDGLWKHNQLQKMTVSKHVESQPSALLTREENQVPFTLSLSLILSHEFSNCEFSYRNRFSLP